MACYLKRFFNWNLFCIELESEAHFTRIWNSSGLGALFLPVGSCTCFKCKMLVIRLILCLFLGDL
jgi:hypothetical protein